MDWETSASITFPQTESCRSATAHPILIVDLRVERWSVTGVDDLIDKLEILSRPRHGKKEIALRGFRRTMRKSL